MINFERLKDIREDHDLSQKKMSEILKVRRSTYSVWELGINIIPLNHVSDFADYFGYSIDYVLGLTYKKENNKIKGFDKKIVGKRIKELRIKNHLSQKELAIVLNVTQACITRYEKGLVEISTSNMYKLSKTFNISMNYLCGKEPIKEKEYSF